MSFAEGSVCARTDFEIAADEVCANSFKTSHKFSSIEISRRGINSEGPSGGAKPLPCGFSFAHSSI